MPEETNGTSSVIAGYETRISALGNTIDHFERRDRIFTRARAALVLLLLAALVLAISKTALSPRLGYWLAGGVFLALVVVAGFHELMLERLRVARVRDEQQRQQQARFERRWADIPVPIVEVPEMSVGISRDLDLFGAGSLYQFVSRAHTEDGKRCLIRWLTEPGTPDEVRLRQAAIRRLAKERSMRDEFELHAGLLSGSTTGPQQFAEWAESEPVYQSQPIRRWLIRALTLMMIVLPIAILAKWISINWILVVYAILGLNVLINGWLVGRVHELFNTITAGKNELFHYLELFQMIDALPDDSERLVELRNRMSHGGQDFRTALVRLRRIMNFGSGRRSSTFGIPYVAAQVIWYWDFHVLEALERWQQKYGKSVRHWFASVGELEALSSLATVADDHPEWCYPSVDASLEKFDAVALGHPLIPVEKCRRNDVALGPPGTFLLVTGSNMSGKSTLLRSIGANTVLAQAGGPVCAEKLELPSVELATSMRVTDSLRDGVSFFLAELHRLKEIVDSSASGGRLLYLLDEILQGTNSAERQIAVASVIGHLLESTGIGAVSTHDLDLAEQPELRGRCQIVHFREQFEAGESGERMTFDYHLRDGISPTTNALKLLEMVGLRPRS